MNKRIIAYQYFKDESVNLIKPVWCAWSVLFCKYLLKQFGKVIKSNIRYISVSKFSWSRLKRKKKIGTNCCEAI